jgi:chromosome transmission fidelity protein 8
MEIPINVPSKSLEDAPLLPPQLVKLGSDEIVLVELQGSLEVEGEKDGGIIGMMSMKNVVCLHPIAIEYAVD